MISLKTGSAFSLLFALSLSAYTSTASAAVESSFRAELRRANVIPAPTGTTPANVLGEAEFTLFEPASNETGEPELTYSITLKNIDSHLYRDGATAETPTSFDDLLHIHVHHAPAGSNTAGTPHVLNILGAPLTLVGDDREDDLVIESYDPLTMTTRITGRWDAADVLQTAGFLMEGPKTKPLANFLTQLKAGQLFMMVHTIGDGIGAIGGHLVAVPEPSAFALLLFGQGMLVCRRRFSRTATQ